MCTFLGGLSSAQAWQAMGEAGRRKVEDQFTWQRIVDRMLPYLKDVAGLSSPG